MISVCGGLQGRSHHPIATFDTRDYDFSARPALVYLIPVSLEDQVEIHNDDDVIAARLKGRTMAAELGFSAMGQSMMAAVITELARNIIAYADSGEVLLQVREGSGRRGITVIARDRGPGILDTAIAMQASYSVAAGLGLGLRGVKGLMDTFDIISVPGKGTTVTALKWRI